MKEVMGRSKRTRQVERRTTVTDLRLVKPASEPKSAGTLERFVPSKSWIDSCASVIEIVRQLLRHNLGASWTVIPQGSFVQGLQLTGSDLDLVLLDGTDRWRTLNRNRNADELDRAVRAVTRGGVPGYRINVTKKIYRARVPLVKLRVTLPQHQIEVDMCFGDPSRGLCDHFVNRAISSSLELTRFCLLMKIWAKQRGLTETHTGGISSFAIVLLALFYYRSNGPRVQAFFEWFISLRAKARYTVCVESQTLMLRSVDAEGDLLHVTVPCRHTENAARCLSVSVWTRKVFPELFRAVSICKQLGVTKDFDLVLDHLLHDRVVGRSNIEFSEGSIDELEAEPWSDTPEEETEEIPEIPELGDSETCRPGVIDLDTDQSSETEETPPPVCSKPNPIQIHECDTCEYFSFNQQDLLNHQFAAHQYQSNEDASKSARTKYRMPRNYTNRSHPYAALTPGRKSRPEDSDDESC